MVSFYYVSFFFVLKKGNEFSHVVIVSLKNYADDYDQGSDHDEYASEGEALQILDHGGHSQSQPLPHTWNQQVQDCQYNQGGYTYPNVGKEQSSVTGDFNTNDFSTEGYEPEPYPHAANNPAVPEGEGGRRDKHTYGDQNNTKHFQVSGGLSLACFVIMVTIIRMCIVKYFMGHMFDCTSCVCVNKTVITMLYMLSPDNVSEWELNSWKMN